MAISDTIRQRIINNDGKYYCNHNISNYIEPTEIEGLIEEVQGKVESLLHSLIIDVDNDHNTQNTAKRVAKMFINETFSGRYKPMPNITSFPNVCYDQVYITGPISIRSTCAHHFQPIKGSCWIGVFPGEKVIGLSKFNRLVHWITERPQIQEEMTQQIADAVEQETKCSGIAVVVKCEHMCMTHRGVREHAGVMTTSVMRGQFREHLPTKQEFLSLLGGMKGYHE